jgi:hypothetical protein
MILLVPVPIITFPQRLDSRFKLFWADPPEDYIGVVDQGWRRGSTLVTLVLNVCASTLACCRGRFASVRRGVRTRDR